MTSPQTQSDAATREAARFAAIEAALPGAELAWLAQLRTGAMEDFAARGFPNPRIEEWKFTNLSNLAACDFTEPAAGIAAPPMAALTPLAIPGAAARHMTFVNGRYRAELSDNGPMSLPITITSLGQALREDPDGMALHLGSAISFENGRARALDSLNAAFMADGAVIRLAQGVEATRPIHLLFLGEPETSETPNSMGQAAVHVRNFIIAEAGAKATVVCTFAGLGGGAYWTNAVTHMICADGAAIDHFTIQKEAAGAYHTGVTEVTLDRGAQYRSFVMSVGASLARHEIAVRLDGPDCVCRLDGIALARGRQHLDNTTRVDHAAPGGTTTENYNCVADGHAHTVFQGKIRVAPHAQKTNADQTNRNLLLSPGAVTDSKPELEILADDVRCSHGATVGELDKDALFYLRSRGLDEASARGLLVEGFVAELIDGVDNVALREHLRRTLNEWLSAETAPGDGMGAGS